MIAFSTLRRAVDRVAAHRALCCTGAGVLVLAVRALLLPVWPIPAPSIYDEFSYMLQADTFAHGRLANPPHPMGQFFESIFVLQTPRYASRYPPGPGLAMAAGQALFGDPWYGVWLSCGALMAALCWALQGWVSGRWAVAGTAIGLHLCLMTYWMNGYWGGAVTAAGGALVLGAFGRILRGGGKVRTGWVLGAGVAVLMLTRPFEGLVLSAPVVAGLAWNRERRRALWPVLACAAAGMVWLGYYNSRVTGRPLQMPYQEYYDQYESVSPFNVVPVGAPRVFRHRNFEWVDQLWALEAWQKARGAGFILARLREWRAVLDAVLGYSVWILPALAFLPWLMRSRKGRWLAGLAALMVAASFFEVNLFAHYPAPFVPVFVILAVFGLRQLGAAVPAAVLPLVLLLVGYRTAVDGWRVLNENTPDRFKSLNAGKSRLEHELEESHPGRHVVFVRYSVPRSPHEEWIYNRADIDGAAVIWAHDMGDGENRKLMAYYSGRQFWSFDPDLPSASIAPYRSSDAP